MAEKARKIEEMSEVEEPGQTPEKTRPVQLNRTDWFRGKPVRLNRFSLKPPLFFASVFFFSRPELELPCPLPRTPRTPRPCIALTISPAPLSLPCHLFLSPLSLSKTSPPFSPNPDTQNHPNPRFRIRPIQPHPTTRTRLPPSLAPSAPSTSTASTPQIDGQG